MSESSESSGEFAPHPQSSLQERVQEIINRGPQPEGHGLVDQVRGSISAGLAETQEDVQKTAKAKEQLAEANQSFKKAERLLGELGAALRQGREDFTSAAAGVLAVRSNAVNANAAFDAIQGSRHAESFFGQWERYREAMRGADDALSIAPGFDAASERLIEHLKLEMQVYAAISAPDGDASVALDHGNLNLQNARETAEEVRDGL